jgi:sulfite exporter TauE/SafE
MVGIMGSAVYGQNGKSEKGHWLLTMSFYTSGSLCASIILGSALALAGNILLSKTVQEVWAMLLLGILSLGYALHEAHILRMPYPQRKCQVPARWRFQFHPYMTAFLFGTLLGLGFVTFVSVASLYIITLASIIQGSLLGGALIMGAFGLGRIILLWPLGYRAKTFEMVEQTALGLYSIKPYVHRVNALALTFCSVYLITIWLSNV